MRNLVDRNGPVLGGGPVKLLPTVTCPHCWRRFPPEQILWISEHVDLLGDARLGPERQQRFLPSRFTVDGDAIDPQGMTCRSLACSYCHLSVPRPMLEVEPLFISILGGPASGKSYFLTVMTWQLRELLPSVFAVAFTDAEPAANRVLVECEELLFLNPRGMEMVPLGNLIRKTELQGELYDTVGYGQQAVSYPRPFLFSMLPQAGHISDGNAGAVSRILCLYDNAGEHFQPGQDTASSPVTHHLALSRAVLFLFDPTQDRRFRAFCRTREVGPAGTRESRLSRQETLLTEAAARIRGLSGLSHQSRYDRPMIVVLSKFDEWAHLCDFQDQRDPWKKRGDLAAVNVELVKQRSQSLRRLLAHHCPETVAAADSFASNVTYIAVSSLGDRTHMDPRTGVASIRPAEIRPHWVTVPLLYALSQVLPGLIPRLKRSMPR